MSELRLPETLADKRVRDIHFFIIEMNLLGMTGSRIIDEKRDAYAFTTF